MNPVTARILPVFVADVTYPDNTTVAASEVFTKTWEIRNRGHLHLGDGLRTGIRPRVLFHQAVSLDDPFPSVAPKGTVELSVAVTAPTTAGTHSGVWVIKRPEGDTIQTQDGQAFDFWAIIVVPSTRTVVTTTETRDVNTDGVVCAQANTTYVNQLLQLDQRCPGRKWIARLRTPGPIVECRQGIDHRYGL